MWQIELAMIQGSDQQIIFHFSFVISHLTLRTELRVLWSLVFTGLKTQAFSAKPFRAMTNEK